ncbi:MAG: 4-hydroxy-tetrahydrodipicolinate reductase [Clostridiales bacterium]|nr:4-hydroxy-tetrahydrodipicolinate reductase [Clostridiales bacterium]
MIKLALCGASGRIGRTITKTLIDSKEFEIVFGVDGFKSETSYPIFSTFADSNLSCDIIIDFSNPSTLDDLLSYALKNKTKVIIATTGHTQEQIEKIRLASKEIAIFKASNMSLGVNLLASLAKEAAKFLGDDFDIEIVETHHNRKLDSPSGTALTLYNSINEVRELSPVFGRHATSKRREKKEIGIHAVRGGTVVGKHDVHFFGTGEVVTLSHESESTDVFAQGALRAARYLMDKSSGLYDMNSILGDFYAVTAVTGEKGVTLVTVPSITMDDMLELFSQIASSGINLDMISQGKNADGTYLVSFTLSDGDSHKMFGLLGKTAFTSLSGTAKLTIEGAGMEHRSGVALEVFNLLKKAGVNLYAVTTSETKISCCINGDALLKAESIIKRHYGI